MAPPEKNMYARCWLISNRRYWEFFTNMKEKHALVIIFSNLREKKIYIVKLHLEKEILENYTQVWTRKLCGFEIRML